MLRNVKRAALLAVAAALLVAGCGDDKKAAQKPAQKPAAEQPEPKPGPAMTFVSRPDLKPPRVRIDVPREGHRARLRLPRREDGRRARPGR